MKLVLVLLAGLPCVAAGALLLLPKPAHEDTRGFLWAEPSLSLGECALGRVVSARTTWRTAGNDAVEVVHIQPSCGCSMVKLHREGREFTAGRLEPGSHGTAMVSMLSKGRSGRSESTVDVIWRRAGDQTLQRSRLSIACTFFDAFLATPPAILAKDVPAGQAVPFEVTWRALRKDVSGGSPSMKPDPLVRVDSIEQGWTPEGFVMVHAKGSLRPSSTHDFLVQASLEVDGFDPALPEVKAEISYRRLVARTPAGIVSLRDGGDGEASATIELSLAAEIAGAGLRDIQVEPESERDRVSATWKRRGPDSLQIMVRGRFAPTDKHATGTIHLRGDRPEVGDIPVRWMYLRTSRTSMTDTRSEVETRR